ncbi:Dephospho-CoA kinase [Pontiella desulfatans]|uniref:Dephospho-CoA kinase n=1 Tax=Pontiella desulfatans TaxID=2750659 RepID=A0A6C2U2W8_PONDE|nr:dephospho-CoA kinase [Pontiella desulfatans]VGO14149.1 Dephospho-CoA kinase [Pontiella desulfatans]
MSDKKRYPIVLGLTGGIACGKSEVGRILGEMGFAVCDADRVAHELMRKGTPVFQQVVDSFGNHILADDGEISRPILGKIVFENPARRTELDALVHPAVRVALEGWIAERRFNGENAAVQIPLLFESGMETLDWDAVFCVSSSGELVLQRLGMRGLGREEAMLRIQSQMPLAQKEARADHVVPNLGTLEELEAAVRQAVEQTAVRKG